jgi:uncharacterized phage protein gp47/JayE
MVDIAVKSRDQIVEDYQRAYKLRNPSAEVGPGTQAYIDAVTLADSLLPMYANAQRVGASIGLDGQSAGDLDESARDVGIARASAVGSVGYVTLRTSSGGATILAGDGLREPNTGLRFTFTETATYTNGSQARIAAADTGPATNLDAGTTLQISNPRPGCAPTCTIAEQSGGAGLTGGADSEGDESLRSRIRERRRKASDYVKAIYDTPGVQVEAAFIYPCAYGPSTLGFTFTVPGTSRIPSAAQQSAVLAQLESASRGTDVFYSLGLLPDPKTIVARVKWLTGSARWIDNSPWPGCFATSPGSGSAGIIVDPAITPTATSFRLKTINGNYSSTTNPVAGQTIAIFDKDRRRFSRKRIATVIGTGPWMITCDTTFGATDTSFVPYSGLRVCPWSDALDSLVSILFAHFAKLGPGEMFADSYIGGRALRQPQSPLYWPSTLTQDLASELFKASGIANLSVVEGIGDSASVTGLAPALPTIGDFAVFAL